MVEEQLLQEAGEAAAKGDTESEIEALKEAAEMGYAPALARLGQMLIDGEKVSKDEEKGREMLIKAQRQGLDI